VIATLLAPHRARRSGPLAFLALLALATGWLWLDARQPAADAGVDAPPTAVAPAADDLARLRAAFAEGRGDLWVTLAGRVERTLPDDQQGSRHQRFVLRLDEDLTVLVAHNLDLAPRVPLERGDRLRLRGEYEWNARGGVVHWTHHDPAGKPGGWIDFDGRRYE
jgi:hypothetical protein